MFDEHNQFGSTEHMLTVMASKSAHSNNFHLQHGEINSNNRRAGATAASPIARTVGGGSGMEHLFAPYDVSQAPGQLLPFSLYQIDQSNRKPTISPQQPQKWMGGSSLKAHPHPRYRFGLSSLFGPTKEAKAPTPTSSVAKPKTQTQNKTILRNPEKAPRGCPAGHWWCKYVRIILSLLSVWDMRLACSLKNVSIRTCSKYLTLEHFNPSTKAMQYKYLCANCETKTKQDQVLFLAEYCYAHNFGWAFSLAPLLNQRFRLLGCEI